jgi:hypothetical protein
MYRAIFILAIGFCSCRPGRDIPQAEIGTFMVISADTILQYTTSRYVTTLYDMRHKVTYTVYTNYPSGLRKGQTIPGLIRK